MKSFGHRHQLWMPCAASNRPASAFAGHAARALGGGKASCPECGKVVLLGAANGVVGTRSIIPRHRAAIIKEQP